MLSELLLETMTFYAMSHYYVHDDVNYTPGTKEAASQIYWWWDNICSQCGKTGNKHVQK